MQQSKFQFAWQDFFMFLLLALALGTCNKYNAIDCKSMCGDNNVKSCGWFKAECK